MQNIFISVLDIELYIFYEDWGCTTNLRARKAYYFRAGSVYSF